MLFISSIELSGVSHSVEQAVACASVMQRTRVQSPVWTSFLCEVFWGFYSPVRQMSGSFRPTRSPNIIWPSSSSFHTHLVRMNVCVNDLYRLLCLCCLRGGTGIELKPLLHHHPPVSSTITPTNTLLPFLPPLLSNLPSAPPPPPSTITPYRHPITIASTITIKPTISLTSTTIHLFHPSSLLTDTLLPLLPPLLSILPSSSPPPPSTITPY